MLHFNGAIYWTVKKPTVDADWPVSLNSNLRLVLQDVNQRLHHSAVSKKAGPYVSTRCSVNRLVSQILSLLAYKLSITASPYKKDNKRSNFRNDSGDVTAGGDGAVNCWQTTHGRSTGTEAILHFVLNTHAAHRLCRPERNK